MPQRVAWAGVVLMLGWAKSMLFSGRSDAVRIAEASRDRARAEAVTQTTKLLAKYDNAQTTDENSRNWWSTDYFSAKAANSFAVRRTLRIRSRYEVANNPFLFGVACSNANHLIGTGPTLKVLTKDDGYNREVEKLWSEWADEVGLVEKLKTQKLAKTVDGEGFLVLKTVADLDHPVKLYPVDVEADQVTTYDAVDMAQLWLDGLILHPVTGRPTAYHVLRHHPGDFYFPDLNPLRGDKVSAKFVLHLFRKFRPGQVRGIPEFTSSLDLFAELRAFRRAVLANAQIAAALTALLTQSERTGAYGPGEELPPLNAYEKVPINRGFMTTLPPGADVKAFDPKQPGTTYEMFQEKCLGEAIRPLTYPLVLALGTAQKFNFSSAKLDLTDYHGSLDVERATDIDVVSLDPILKEWFFEALMARSVRAFDGVKPPPHEWHWPGHQQIDPKVDADADHARLAAGTKTYKDFWASRGYDWNEMFQQLAAERKVREKLGLVFGDPLKQTVTDNDGDGQASNAEEAANAA